MCEVLHALPAHWDPVGVSDPRQGGPAVNQVAWELHVENVELRRENRRLRLEVRHQRARAKHWRRLAELVAGGPSRPLPQRVKAGPLPAKYPRTVPRSDYNKPAARRPL